MTLLNQQNFTSNLIRVTNIIVIITIRIYVAKDAVSPQTLTIMPPP